MGSRTRLWWLLGWLQGLILLVATLWPEVILPGPEDSDKLIHALSFGWLMGWFSQVVIQRRWRLVALLIAYGAVIELLQWLSGYRFGDWWDLLADAVGVVIVWIAVHWWLSDLPGRLFGVAQR